MDEAPLILSVMGRCQCVETSSVPPGGDSREQRDYVQLPFIQEEGEEEEHSQKDPSSLNNIHQESKTDFRGERGLS